jgi:hypothetical protein
MIASGTDRSTWLEQKGTKTAFFLNLGGTAVVALWVIGIWLGAAWESPWEARMLLWQTASIGMFVWGILCVAASYVHKYFIPLTPRMYLVDILGSLGSFGAGCVSVLLGVLNSILFALGF